jgi:hypothetical protein
MGIKPSELLNFSSGLYVAGDLRVKERSFDHVCCFIRRWSGEFPHELSLERVDPSSSRSSRASVSSAVSPFSSLPPGCIKKSVERFLTSKIRPSPLAMTAAAIRIGGLVAVLVKARPHRRECLPATSLWLHRLPALVGIEIRHCLGLAGSILAEILLVNHAVLIDDERLNHPAASAAQTSMPASFVAVRLQLDVA